MTPKALKQHLTQLGWSQRELASRLGRPNNTVHRWASGAQPIPSEVALWLAALARALAANPPPQRQEPFHVAPQRHPR
jgi:transcriptional regulator with XRE-family HTH domain